MTRQSWIAGCTLVLGLTLLGVGLLTADEPNGIPKQRVNPKVLKELSEHPVITATVPHSPGRNIQDLRAIVSDLEKAGHKSEATRLNSVIKEMVRHAEQDLADKKAQVARLNAEIEDLKWATNQ